jgi:hypothetical protein
MTNITPINANILYVMSVTVIFSLKKRYAISIVIMGDKCKIVYTSVIFNTNIPFWTNINPNPPIMPRMIKN